MRSMVGASLAVLALPAGAGAAEQLYGVTDDGNLVHFTSQAPGAVTKQVGITGLAQGDRVVGIDVRPATDQLFAVGASSRVYLLNPTTGRARAVAGGPFNPALSGANFGVDFNPTVDRIRVVSDADQNLRLNPNDGQLAANDSALAYAAGDPGTGTNPVATASAYTNSVPRATTTQLFNIDSGRDVLVLQNPPNAGTLNTVGALGVDASEVNGFDIAADGAAYAAFAGSGGSRLFRIDLGTGAATPAAGDRSAVAGGRTLVGLAAAGTVADDNTRPRVLLQADRVQDDRRVLRAGVDAAASCSETCTLAATVTRGSRRLGTASGAVDGGGFDSIDVRLTSAGRQVVRRGPARLQLTVVATDPAGNATTRRTTITVR